MLCYMCTDKMWKNTLHLLCAASLLLATAAQAQDTNHWNLQYGTGATLLGGAVIGSVSDLSAT